MQTEAATFLSGVVGLQLARYKATVNYWNELCKLNSSRCSVRFGKPAEFILENFSSPSYTSLSVTSSSSPHVGLSADWIATLTHHRLLR